MIEKLLDAGATVCAYDPEAMENVKAASGTASHSPRTPTALTGADALLICTEWQVFRTPDFDRMKGALNNPIVFDGRNLYDLADMANHGWEYTSIGRRGTHS